MHCVRIHWFLVSDSQVGRSRLFVLLAISSEVSSRKVSKMKTKVLWDLLLLLLGFGIELGTTQNPAAAKNSKTKDNPDQVSVPFLTWLK